MSTADRRSPPPAGTSEAIPLLKGLPPIINDQVRILLLGSFPGQASLTAGQYYAHPRNQFWPLLGAVLQEPLAALPYAERLERLLAHHIGLWDVLAACERIGSLDTAIRQAQINDFAVLAELCPELRRVCFNGKTAGRHASAFQAAGYEVLILPSSSPAHAAMRFEQKLATWQSLTG